jgi:hypothetical protein
MTGSLRQAWIYTPADLWEPLAAYSTKDVSAPPDLFSDLFMAVDDSLAVATPEAQLEQIRNDPNQARASFLALKGTDFASESAIVEFLEAAHEVITDYDLPSYEEFFKRLLRDFLRKYNLRYRLDEPFMLRFLLPGSFTNLYAELHRLNAGNPHLATLLSDFEHAFDAYARGQNAADLRRCIAAASNFAEGLASATAGNPSAGNTLGALATRLTDWPHDKMREALVNLYHFCCDYPGIGTPASARRVLATRDATSLSVLLLAFSGYLAPHLDEQAVLGARL